MNPVQEIFSRDPRKCTPADMDVLIKNYRERRAQFNLGNMQAGSVKQTAKEKEAAAIIGKLDLSKELGL